MSEDKTVKRLHILFDIELHHQMRARAIREEKSNREFVEQAVKFYLDSVKEK